MDYLFLHCYLKTALLLANQNGVNTSMEVMPALALNEYRAVE